MRAGPDHWIIENGVVVPITVWHEVDGQMVMDEVALMRWGEWMERPFSETRRVAYHVIHNKVRVSTVFLGLDHSFTRQGPPVLWETMVFGGELDNSQERYTSKEDAARGHYEWLARAQRAAQHPTYQRLAREHAKRFAEAVREKNARPLAAAT